MELHYANSPKINKFKTQSSMGKFIATVFFDSKGLLLVDIMLHRTTTNSDVYLATVKKLQTRLCRDRSHCQKQDISLPHDCARPYVSHKTTGEIRKLGCTTVKHPPYTLFWHRVITIYSGN